MLSGITSVVNVDFFFIDMQTLMTIQLILQYDNKKRKCETQSSRIILDRLWT